MILHVVAFTSIVNRPDDDTIVYSIRFETPPCLRAFSTWSPEGWRNEAFIGPVEDPHWPN